MEKPQKTISVKMHYATMAALIVSNLCTLGLAMLFSQSYGLAIGNVANEIEKGGLKASAAVSQRNQPRSKELVSERFQLGRPLTAQLAGYVTLVEDPLKALDDSIVDGDIGNPSSGSDFKSAYTYNLDTKDQDPTPNVGYYFIEKPFTFVVGNYTYTTKQIMVSVYDNIVGTLDALVIRPVLDAGSTTNGPSKPLLVNGLELQLQDSSGMAFKNDSLPEKINLDSFTWSSASIYGTALDNNDAYWFIYGPLTGIDVGNSLTE